MDKLEQKMSAEAKKPEKSYNLDPLDEIFKNDYIETNNKEINAKKRRKLNK